MCSRIHPLRGFGLASWVKRDDELSFGISGSKWRKYEALVAASIEVKIEEWIVIGGSRSNNVLAALQRGIERGIKVTPFLLAPHEKPFPTSLINLFISEDEIHWVARKDWHRVEGLAREYQCRSPMRSLILPEGAHHIYCYEGGFALAREIRQQCLDMSLQFDEIFIDSGSGLTAQTFICEISHWETKPLISVVALAGSPEEFTDGLCKLASRLQIPSRNLPTYRLLRPPVGRSFGSSPRRVFQEVRRVASQEGILVDPIYSAKLFMTAREHQLAERNQLLIHSGGGLSLFGFVNRLH